MRYNKSAVISVDATRWRQINCARLPLNFFFCLKSLKIGLRSNSKRSSGLTSPSFPCSKVITHKTLRILCTICILTSTVCRPTSVASGVSVSTGDSAKFSAAEASSPWNEDRAVESHDQWRSMLAFSFCYTFCHFLIHPGTFCFIL